MIQTDKKRVVMLLALVWALLAVPEWAGAAQYTLHQCIAQTLDRNPAMQVGYERKNQAEYEKKSVGGNLLPSLNVDYSYLYKKDTTTLSFPQIGDFDISRHNNYAMALRIDQPLFSGFRLIESYRLADIGLMSARAGEDIIRLDLIFQTTSAYYRFLLELKNKKVSDEAVAQYASHLHDAEKFYQNEVVPLNEVLQAKVYLANAKQTALKAETEVGVARQNLATLMHHPLGQVFYVEDSAQTERLDTEVHGLVDIAYNRRPELKQANYNVDAALKKILLAKGDLFPMVNLRAQHSRYGDDPLVNGDGLTALEQSDESTLAIIATWELWGGNSTTNDVRKARAGEREARQTLIQVLDEIELEVRTNYERAQTSFSNIDTARVAVEQAKENFRMNQLRYREQLATNTDVLDARRLLSETEYQYYASLYDYNILLAGLARSAGLEDIRTIEEVQVPPGEKSASK